MIHSNSTRMLLFVDPHSGLPLYRQLVEQVSRHIAGGLLKPGQRLPCARELSFDLGVNPSGVSKAYRHLERAGFLERHDGHALVAPAERLPAPRPLLLDEDLELASQIQSGLLPQRSLTLGGWEVSYLYDPFGPTGGDYCDLVPLDGGDFFFIVGDVAGKGLAAALLMAHLHASFRALISPDVQVEELVERVSRAFCESTPSTHFATLVCGRACRSGEMMICNAGHPPPLLVHEGEVTKVPATGLPVGLFSDEEFTAENAISSTGDTLLLYTDGLTEAVNSFGIEYGSQRLAHLVRDNSRLPPDELVSTCRADSEDFRSGAPRADDVTIMAIRRNPGRH